MSWKRSERLIDMTNYLLNHPRELISLTFSQNGTKQQNHQLVKI